MKIVRNHIFEKFEEDSDPIYDMGIGPGTIIKGWKEKIFKLDYELSNKNSIICYNWHKGEEEKMRTSVILRVKFDWSTDFSKAYIKIEATGRLLYKDGYLTDVDKFKHIFEILHSLNLTQFFEPITQKDLWYDGGLDNPFLKVIIKPNYIKYFENS